MTATSTTAATWPFWAPSREAAVAEALGLAGVGPDDRFVDLGCGDGQVLLAAAARGAAVAGIESDAELVDEARGHLASAGVEADVQVGDLLDPTLRLDAEVFFSYLAPATLQRLVPALPRAARLVTVDFDVPGLVPTRRGEAARLYVLPGRRRRIGLRGWPCAGTLVSTVPDCQSLTCLEVVHPGGRVELGVTASLRGVATAFAGADVLAGPAHLAVDVRWEPMAAGSVFAGTIRMGGLDSHDLFVIATDEEDEGMWDLTAGGVAGLRHAVRSAGRPTTLAALLDAATR